MDVRRQFKGLFCPPLMALLICMPLCGCGFSLVGFDFGNSSRLSEARLPSTVDRIESADRPKVSGHLSPVVGLSLLPDSSNRQLVSVDSTGSVLLWDLTNGGAVKLLQLSETPDQISILPSRALLATAHVGKIGIFDLQTGKLLWSLSRLKARITSMAFQSDAQALLIGGADGRVYRWKFLQEVDARNVDEREKSLERYAAHSSIVSSVIAHPYGRAFFTSDLKGNLYGWLPYDADGFNAEYAENLFGGRFFAKESISVLAERAMDAGIVVMRMSSDGERFVIGTQDGWIEVWRVKGFKKIARFQAHRGLVYAVALNDEGSEIVTMGRDGRMQWYAIEKDPRFGLASDSLEYRKRELASYALPQARLVELRDDHHVISCREDGTVIEISLTEKLQSSKDDELDLEAIESEIKDTDY